HKRSKFASGLADSASDRCWWMSRCRLTGMKPKRLHHINKIHDGVVVRVRRENLQRYAFRTTLKAALAVRDEFLAGHLIEYPRPSFSTKAHSNTGYVGICETHQRSRRKKNPCYAVSWAPAPREQQTRFFR